MKQHDKSNLNITNSSHQLESILTILMKKDIEGYKNQKFEYLLGNFGGYHYLDSITLSNRCFNDGWVIDSFFENEVIMKMLEIEKIYFNPVFINEDFYSYDEGYYSHKLKIFFIFDNVKLLFKNIPRIFDSDDYDFKQIIGKVLELDEGFEDSEIEKNLFISKSCEYLYFVHSIYDESNGNDCFGRFYSVSLATILKLFLHYHDESTPSRIELLYNKYRNEKRKIMLNKVSNYIDDVSFRKKLYEVVFKNISTNYSILETEIVYKYLLSCKNSKNYCRSLLTYNYTFTILKSSDESIDFLDLTFIAVSLFKLAESIFCDFVNCQWPNKRIKSNCDGDGAPIYLGNNKLTLGSLVKIFECDDVEVNNFIKFKKKYAIKLQNLLIPFISFQRNQFLHKNSIKYNDELRKSIDDGLNAIFLLILFFK